MTKVEFIDLPVPLIGSKIWLLDKAGMFVLERGAGLIRTDACTHAGAGTVLMFDGIPDERGFFDEHKPIPETDMAELVRNMLRADASLDEERARTRIKKSAFNGRVIYKANPTVMGSWMLDGGFYHGLTIEASGGHEMVAPFASIVWMPRVKMAPR